MAQLRHSKGAWPTRPAALVARSHTGLLSPDAASGLARLVVPVFPEVPNRSKRLLRARALRSSAAYGSVVAAESGDG